MTSGRREVTSRKLSSGTLTVTGLFHRSLSLVPERLRDKMITEERYEIETKITRS